MVFSLEGVVETIDKLTKGNCIITTEVGQNQMWAAQFFKYRTPRTFLSSGGLGTMGYGFPAAIGAQAAYPDKLVFDIAGDGSIQMNIQELATAVLYKLPVKVVILNNSYLGMVRQWQELFYQERYSSVDLGSVPDFVKVAEAYSAVGLRARAGRSVVEESEVPLTDDAAARVREERLAAGRRVVEAAGKHGVEFILVAGDLFEHNGVDRVLVQKAAMPTEGDLPDDLKMLARRQATEIDDTHWDSDTEQLIETLAKLLPGEQRPTSRETVREVPPTPTEEPPIVGISDERS